MSDAPAKRIIAVSSPLHSGIRVGTVLTLQILSTLFPLLAGFLVYGWRAIGTTAAVSVRR